MIFFTKFQGGEVAAVQHPTRRPWFILTCKNIIKSITLIISLTSLNKNENRFFVNSKTNIKINCLVFNIRIGAILF